MKNKFYNHIVQLQENLCKEFEEIDGKGKFFEDKWDREGGGGGITRIIEEYQWKSDIIPDLYISQIPLILSSLTRSAVFLIISALLT